MENGELRFRLLHESGDGYIRTQATSESGWQKSHVHKRLMETYVVQSGWMALAELIHDQIVVRIFETNDLVTTKPGVTHNVYLPADAVIHTVKHGVSQEPDREAGKYGAALDLVTSSLDNEPKIRAEAIRSCSLTKYSKEYRHFDNLIWQVPAWATAIFALSVQSVLGVLGRTEGQVGHWRWLAVLIFFLMGCVACFSIAMARFRVHQRAFKGFARTSFWLSASTWAQSLVTLEGAALAGMALVFSGMPVGWAVGLSVIGGVAAITATENVVRRTKVK